MKTWKILMQLAGLLLLVASFAVYVARISSCYPPANIWAQYTPEYISGMMQTCKFYFSVLEQFTLFLILFVPGIILFSAYWLITRPVVKSRRGGMLGAFIIFIMFDSLLVMVYGLLGYPVPGSTGAPTAWVAEVIAVLGFICYLSTLAIWHWKRWGLLLFQGASMGLAVFILLGGQSLILAGVIIAGMLGLSVLIRPVRHKMV
jgi:quinol-cytochrome oxidoreductase complex cytochrome b subunit